MARSAGRQFSLTCLPPRASGNTRRVPGVMRPSASVSMKKSQSSALSSTRSCPTLQIWAPRLVWSNRSSLGGTVELAHEPIREDPAEGPAHPRNDDAYLERRPFGRVRDSLGDRLVPSRSEPDEAGDQSQRDDDQRCLHGCLHATSRSPQIVAGGQGVLRIDGSFREKLLARVKVEEQYFEYIPPVRVYRSLRMNCRAFVSCVGEPLKHINVGRFGFET
jgi:hypothetical protein